MTAKPGAVHTAHIPMHRRWLAAGLAGLAVLMGSLVPQQTFAQTGYDADNDNLIEVMNLEQLNAIRYDPDGDGTPTPSNMSDYAAAFPTSATSMGCPATCKGYELMANLDFDTNGDGEITAADGVLSWGEGADAGNGWEPIGTRSANPFTAVFDGNGHTISHLFINRIGSLTRTFSLYGSHVGLFGYIDTSNTVIRSVGLVGVDVTGNVNVGALVGRNAETSRDAGTIRASYATGEVRGNQTIGGLVGQNNGTIDASYTAGEVSEVNSVGSVGGLAGTNGGTINASYQPVGLTF